MNVLHSGGLGDIIYSLPYVKWLHETTGKDITYYIKPVNYHCDQYKELRYLLMEQEYINYCYPYIDSMYGHRKNFIDVDLDVFRHSGGIMHQHIILCYQEMLGVQIPNWANPWLTPLQKVEGVSAKILINRTKRYRNSSMNWKDVYESRIKGEDHAFIGYREEWEDFCEEVGHTVPYIETSHLLNVAHMINNCEILYCNQSVCLTIAQGLGVQYALEVAPGHTNCLLHRPEEIILVNP